MRTGGTFDVNGATESIDGLAGGGTVTSTGGALTIGASHDAALSAYTIGAAAAGVASTGLNNFTGTISGSIALFKGGAGTQILGGTSTYTGLTTITSGTLKMSAINALPNGAGKGDLSIIGNTVVSGLIVPGTLDLGGYNQAINGLNSATGGVVVNTPTVMFTTAWGTPFGVGVTSGTSTLSVGNGNAPGAFNGVLQDGFSVLPVAGAGAGTGVNGLLALNKVGTGTQTLSGVNTYSGGTTVSGGMLQLSGSGTIGATTAGLTLAGGTFDIGGLTRTVGAFAITAAATSGDTLQNGSLTGTSYVVSNPTGTATVSANLLGTAALNKSGAGMLALTGTNNYSGGTTIDGGTIQINSTSSLGAIGGAVVINAGTLQATADIPTTRSFQLGSASSTVAVDAAKTYSVSGSFTNGAGTGTLNKSGLGTLVLTGTNGYTGGTNVAAGTLQVGTGGTAGTLGSGAITTGTNATLAINHSDPVTIATAIGGTGNFAQLGGGTTILTGANGYAGTTTISNGTLQVGNGGTVGALGAGAVTNNANLSFQRTDAVTVASTDRRQRHRDAERRHPEPEWRGHGPGAACRRRPGEPRHRRHHGGESESLADRADDRRRHRRADHRGSRREARPGDLAHPREHRDARPDEQRLRPQLPRQRGRPDEDRRDGRTVADRLQRRPLERHRRHHHQQSRERHGRESDDATSTSPASATCPARWRAARSSAAPSTPARWSRATPTTATPTSTAWSTASTTA